MDGIRLQKHIADSGIASRRKAEELIKQGRVTVNGITVSEMGIKVLPIDEVRVDGVICSMERQKLYIMLNKPVGYISSAKDQFSRKTVLDLVNDLNERLYPIGRLDYDTSGLILLTNDGDLTYKLTHPSHEVSKVYLAEVDGIPDEKDIIAFREGMKIENYTTSAAKLRVIKQKASSAFVEITIHEGKNRQVRKMCDAINHPVLSLKRISIGNIKLGDLPEGKWRFLTKRELANLEGSG